MSPIDTTRRHYEALGTRTALEGHPVDRLVYALPEIGRIDKLVRNLTNRVARSSGQEKSRRWRQFMDLRLAQLSAHEERFFDVGYELGRLAGLSESSSISSIPEAEELARILREAVALSAVSDRFAAAALLDVSRGLLLRPGHALGGAL